jgi:arabinogalactan endo-1,4-beta-galactosidase
MEMSPPAPPRPTPFFLGADISALASVEQRGGVFMNDGKPADEITIFTEHGWTCFRLRIFVNPNGRGGVVNSLEYTRALAKRIKAAGAMFMLDFHYSDTWADPGKQTKPVAWQNQNLATLATTVKNYTQTTLTDFGNAGVMPDMVQVGNEISSGMLWGTGTGANSAGGKLVFSGSTTSQQTSWKNMGTLLNSAIQGVRAAQGTGPKIQVAIHIDRGAQDDHPKFYFDDLTNSAWGNVSDFDVMGVSYYPYSQPADQSLQSNLNAIATDPALAGKKIMVLETNDPYESLSSQTYTEQDQENALASLKNIMMNLPNDAGEGIVYWAPEMVQISGFSIYNGGATSLFHFVNGNTFMANDALSVFAVPEPGTLGIVVIIGAIGMASRRRTA